MTANPLNQSKPEIKHICSIPDCDNPRKTRGWCEKHYMRWWAHGNPLFLKRPQKKLAEQDVLEIMASDCTLLQMAKYYNVSISAISLIKNRKRWRHVK